MNTINYYLPSIPPNNSIRLCFSIDWNVIPITWHTNLRTESKNPLTLAYSSGVEWTLYQNSLKLQFSNRSAKNNTWLNGASWH